MRKKRVGLNGFATLGDETRLKIFLKIIELSSYSFINDEPVLALNNAKHLCDIFGLAKSTLSHHVEVLKSSGLVFEIKKKKHVYLFPNYASIIEFKNFLDEQVLIYYGSGSYELVADLRLSRLQNIDEETFRDFLIVQGCKNVEQVKDQLGNTKIYFKITGFNEPFYVLVKDASLKIFCIQKNISSSQEVISVFSDTLTKSFQ